MSKDDVNVIAAQGFGQAATVYEQSRPSYPDEAIEWIKTLCKNPDTIVDLGAGTGKFTRLLSSIGAREIIAIEPVLAMRETLKVIPIITKIIDGTAEHIPLDDHTVDMITCAQSFHWFANHRALEEFHRVLKPTGVLVLLWNTSDLSGREWADNITKYIDSLKSDEVIRYKEMQWKDAFDNQKFFSTVQYKQFPHQQRVTRDLMIQRILSTSFIAALSSERKAKVVEDVEKMIDQVDEIRNQKEFDIQHLTDVYWCSPLTS